MNLGNQEYLADYSAKFPHLGVQGMTARATSND